MAVSLNRSFNLFSGCLPTIITSQPNVRQVNHSVMALKTTDVILSEDKWRIILDVDSQAFDTVSATIRNDLTVVSQTKNEFTATDEVKQTDTLLLSLETKLTG